MAAEKSFKLGGRAGECVELALELEKSKEELGGRRVIRESERAARQAQRVRVKLESSNWKRSLENSRATWRRPKGCDLTLPAEQPISKHTSGRELVQRQI